MRSLSLLFNLILVASVNVFAAPQSKDNPTSTTLSVPVADIKSVLVLDGETNCYKDKTVVSDAAYQYNCVTVAPYSMDVSNKTLGLEKTYQGQYTIPLTGISSTKDLTQPSQKAKLHTENMAKIKTYFEDLKSGCMGKTAVLKWDGQGDLSIKTDKYLGEVRCKANKSINAGADSAVSFYDSAKKSLNNGSQSIADHASRIANRANEMQKEARKTVAQKLKDLGDKVQPKQE